MKTLYATSLYLLITCLTCVNGMHIQSASKTHDDYCITVGPDAPASVARRQVQYARMLVVYFDSKLNMTYGNQFREPCSTALKDQVLILSEEGEIVTEEEKYMTWNDNTSQYTFLSAQIMCLTILS